MYILSSPNDRALYVGMTTNLESRMLAHKAGVFECAHTKKYNIKRLVYVEQHGDFEVAARRENRLKRWNREWKVTLIDDFNEGWEDLAPTLGQLAHQTPAQGGGATNREGKK